MIKETAIVCALISFCFSVAASGESSINELVIYSARKAPLLEPVLKAFEAKTGVKVKAVAGKAGVLLSRLEAEGLSTSADLLLTVDAGNLWMATQKKLLVTVESETLNQNVPESFRDDQGRWYGISLRARTIVYNKQKVRPSELSTYEDLANPKWKGRLCLRTSKKVYNQSLVAMKIAEVGVEKSESIVKGWVRNLAAPVFSNDTAVVKAVASGQCAVGIVNSYYFGRLHKENPNINAGLFWPNQDSTGVHVNVSGVGLTKRTANRKNALKFMEWLTSKEAQGIFSGLNFEYPVRGDVSLADSVKNWGEFKQNQMPMKLAGQYQRQAIELFDRVGYQ